MEEARRRLPVPAGTAGIVRISQRNKFCTGDVIEIMKPDGTNRETKVLALYDEEGAEVPSAPHPKQILYVALDQKAETYDLLRVKAADDR